MAFHTSTNYQISAPEPFKDEVHEDVLADLARIGGSKYKSDYDLHIDFSRTLKRLNDGHCVWVNACYVCASLLLLEFTRLNLHLDRIVRFFTGCRLHIC